MTTVRPDPEGKQQHVLETFNVVDRGSSILIDNPCHTDYNAETAIESLFETLRQWGCPQEIILDRDPRFVGSWSGRDFPAAFVRFLSCLNIRVNICPPRRPDKKPFVERFNKTYKYEGIQIYQPTTPVQVQEMNLEFRYYYNYQRPNQALSCGNRPPRQAFAQLPDLAPLPQVVDPDAWLHFIDQQLFKRRVNASGVVKVDKQLYYIGRAHRGRYVVLKVDAPNKQFIVELAGQIIKTLPIKGLYHGQMSLGDYLKFIQVQAVSEWRHYKQQARRYVAVTM